MADEKKPEEGGGGGGGNKLIIIVIAAVVALLLIIFVVVLLLVMSGGDESQGQNEAQGQPAAAAGNPAQNMRSGGSVYLTMGPIYKFEQLIVNLSSQSGRRYLKTTMDAELNSPNLSAEIDTKVPAIRDTLISVLSSKTIEEISTAKGKDKLKDELVERINESLVDGKIVNIFFTEFVIQ